jgi:trimethylamine--corrinoid protein Co-methyltransferase
LTAIDVAMVPPLRCTGEQADAMLACARWGLPIEVLTSPQLAVSAPVTLAGGAAIALAECIAALCLVYLVSPGLGIIATARVQPTNLRAMTINYGAPELGMASVLVGACCARYGIPSNLYGLGTIAAAPGGQAEMEKTASGLLMALGRAHMITGSGMLDNGLVTSPEQLVIDAESIRFKQRIRRPIPIDESAIGVDAFLQGIRDTGAMLGELHTLEHLRRGEVVSATLGQWDPREWQKGEVLADLLWDRAHGRVAEILGSHRVEPYEASLERRIAAALDEAAMRF